MVRLVMGSHGYKKETSFDLEISSCPTVAASGMGSYKYWIETDGKPVTNRRDKPKFKIPSMSEISATQKNGRRVFSLFSGCGGSSLGYKMAGYSVAWANEFIPAAQEVYRLNHPDTILDINDIRLITTDSILEATGVNTGELDILDGSPPCASFSTSGVVNKGWGKSRKYSDSAQVTDDLFWEYMRILKGLMPKVFVAENVSGLAKGKSVGYFLDILNGLKQCGYNVKCKMLDAQWLGVPQVRKRIIFIGVRNDIGLQPAFPKPLPYRYSVCDAIPELTMIQTGSYCSEWKRSDRPMGTIASSDGSRKHRSQCEHHDSETGKYTRRKFTIAELKRICAFPDDFALTGTYEQQWERLGRAVPPVMMKAVAETVYNEVLSKCR